MPANNSSSGIRAQIWAFDPKLAFQDVQALQKDNFFEVIHYLESKNFKRQDKQLFHKWEVDTRIKYFTLKDEKKSKVAYYTSQASIERAVSEVNAFVDETKSLLLARDRRVFSIEADVIFVNLDNRIYSIVFGSKSAFDVKNVLMGQGFKQRRRESWGKIDIRPVQYHLDSDFYYWLFEKHRLGQSISTIYGDIEIRDIEGIGRYSDRQQHNTKGKGPNSTQELSNKTALGINQLVYESDFNIVTDELDCYINLGEQSIIDSKRSIFTGASGVKSVSTNFVKFFLKLYLEIIPGLLQAYRLERDKKTWTPLLAAKTQKKWALEVVDELSRHHSLSKRDLLGLPWFSSQP